MLCISLFNIKLARTLLTSARSDVPQLLCRSTHPTAAVLQNSSTENLLFLDVAIRVPQMQSHQHYSEQEDQPDNHIHTHRHAHTQTAAKKLTRAGPLSTGTDNVAPQWGSAVHTGTASGARHLPGAAGPGSTLPSSTP